MKNIFYVLISLLLVIGVSNASEFSVLQDSLDAHLNSAVRCVTFADPTITADSTTAFTVSDGYVKIHELYCVVTTEVEAQATTVKMVFDATTGTSIIALDAGTADLNGNLVGTMLRCGHMISLMHYLKAVMERLLLRVML